MGSTLVPILLAQGHQVRVVDSLLHGGASLLGSFSNPDFEFSAADIRDQEIILSAVHGVDAVVHLAAIVGDPACAWEPDIARELNLDTTIRLFHACEENGIGRFVFASTCSNYGKMEDPTKFLNEESRLLPISVYAETKVAAEASLLDSFSSDRCVPTILRFATLFGISPRLRFDLTVNEFTKTLLTDRELVLYGEQFWRPYVHVRDAARAIVMVLEAPASQVSGQVYNVGDTKENYQKGQLVDLIQARIGEPMNIQHVQKTEDPRDYRVSFDKIAGDLDYQITRTVADGIDEIVDAIRSGVISNLDDPSYSNLKEDHE